MVVGEELYIPSGTPVTAGVQSATRWQGGWLTELTPAYASSRRAAKAKRGCMGTKVSACDRLEQRRVNPLKRQPDRVDAADNDAKRDLWRRDLSDELVLVRSGRGRQRAKLERTDLNKWRGD